MPCLKHKNLSKLEIDFVLLPCSSGSLGEAFFRNPVKVKNSSKKALEGLQEN